MDPITDEEGIPTAPERTQLGEYAGAFQMITERFESTQVHGNARGRMESFVATLYLVLKMPDGGGPALVEIASAKSPYSELEAAQELLQELRKPSKSSGLFGAFFGGSTVMPNVKLDPGLITASGGGMGSASFADISGGGSD